ncbi:PREDICTED: probable NADH dehydrogenase [ubiquinone] 1 alpha subcomplex subunit 12 [Ceratosolen solmsi marchali]|uniref:NADH dehydrogenase [ubiquinone] 1 alpha subcomplex subunit 12 n=1 Tax=Ceratosolen solmsi marchali TaxID=326594 RepID=A0AAJ6YH80_9HYME|nr:PREDICTED: probable NADH dehydrogenase [ubiquinone] 1 alpha subcomplex subunit 12 [Ceratosolen solmsi marchali]
MERILGHTISDFIKAIKQNGGIINSIKVLHRMDAIKLGKLVGQDEFGNKYYENNNNFVCRNRWVVYNEQLSLNYDASQVPPEWHGWLHYKTDLLPHQDPSRKKYKWMIKHTPNYSGTELSYVPYSTVKPKIEPWNPKK